MKKIMLGAGLHLPAEDALEGVNGIIGKRGRGKSGLVKVLMEEFCRLKMPFVAFDPVGILWGIRSSLNGNGEGYKVLVIGGQHGDLKLDRRAGGDVARAVVKSNCSCIIDFSDEPKSVYRQFVQEFSDTLYRINDAPRHVIVEEAPELVPQRLRPDMAGVFEAVERLVSRGRNKGIGVTLVSQRTATIAKDVLTQLDTLFVFGLTSPQDRKALMEWVECKADKGAFADFEKGLASLKRQEAWVWSPESFNLFRAFKVRNMTTFHPDKTHLRRTGMLSARPVESDVSAVVKTLGEALNKLAKTKEEGVSTSVLQQKLIRLERELAQEKAKPAAKACGPECKSVRDQLQLVQSVTNMAAQTLESVTESLRSKKVTAQPYRTPVTAAPAPVLNRLIPPPLPHQPRKEAPADLMGEAGTHVGLTASEQSALDAAAAFPGGATRRRISIYSGRSYRSSSFQSAFPSLIKSGLLRETGDHRFEPTEAGAALARPTIGTSLQDWLRKLAPSEAKILMAVSDAYPERLTRAQVAERTGQSQLSSSFQSAFPALRELHLIEGASDFQASAELFS